MTPAGIEPATFRFVAQHLHHCATAVPPLFIGRWMQSSCQLALFGYPDRSFSVLFPQLWGKYQGITRKDGTRPALFPISLTTLGSNPRKPSPPTLLTVSFYVLFVCKCVLYYCQRVSTQLQLTNTSYVTSHLIISYIKLKYSRNTQRCRYHSGLCPKHALRAGYSTASASGGERIKRARLMDRLQSVWQVQPSDHIKDVSLCLFTLSNVSKAVL